MKPNFGVKPLLAILLQSRVLLGLLIVLVAVFLVAGLYPFNFLPANEVSWIPEGRGVRFNGYGQILGFWNVPAPPPTSDTAPGVTLELWVACAYMGPDRNDLLSVYQADDQEPFAIEQSITDLIIAGVVQDRQGQRKFRHMSIDDALSAGTPRFLTITTNADGTTLYLEGLPQKSYPRLRLADENFGGTVLLGQTARAHQEWKGEVRGLALYRKALSADEVLANYNAWRQSHWPEMGADTAAAAIYRFDEGRGRVIRNHENSGHDLVMPERLRATHPVVLGFPSKNDLTDVSDVTLNLLGFVPLGLLLFLYLKARIWKNSRAVVATIGAGFAISLAIELLQVFLPSRDSSLLDLINNTAGSGIGAWLGVVALPWIRRTVQAGPALH